LLKESTFLKLVENSYLTNKEMKPQLEIKENSLTDEDDIKIVLLISNLDV
jgi:hypothetical protein